jgi:hypothetical protein
MIKAGRYDLDETSMGRIYQHIVSNPKMNSWAVITGSRLGRTSAENKLANKKLEADLRDMGLGFSHADGMWRECKDDTLEYKDCPEEMRIPSPEKVMFIPNISKEDAKALGKKYNQDSVLFADGEARKNGEATYIDSKSGEEFNIGKFTPGKITQGYTKLKGDKVFTFLQPDQDSVPYKKDEPKIEPKAEPGSQKMVANPTQLKSLLPKGIADKMIKNPETGKMIKVKSALKYDKDSPVYKATVAMVKQAIKK